MVSSQVEVGWARRMMACWRFGGLRVVGSAWRGCFAGCSGRDLVASVDGLVVVEVVEALHTALEAGHSQEDSQCVKRG